MRSFRIIFFLIIISFNIYSNNINSYEVELIKVIKKGNAQNELMWDFRVMPGEPSAFNIYNDTIYIIDSYNGRIVLYDLNLNFKKIFLNKNEIEKKIKSDIFFSIAIKFDNYGNYYLLEHDLGIYKMNKKELLFNIPNSSLPYTTNLNPNEYFLIDNYIYINKSGRDNIVLINNEGKIFTKDDAWKILESLEGFGEGIFSNTDIQKKFKLFLKNNSILCFNGRIIVSDFSQYLLYREFIEKNFKGKIFNDKIKINITNYECSSRGFDKNNNLYWWARKENTFDDIILVYNKYGECIDVFHDELTTRFIINKNGDIYFMKRTTEGICFYRIRNTWDPIDSPDIPTQSTEPVVTSLTASSYNTYKNMYTPLKAFDGDINTAWLEAAKGPGIGESITLELDREITIDSIQVLPGLFDAKWWKSNNRVKSLIMKTDDSTTTLQFQDAMKPHKADFKEPKTFKKVEFIIKEVYPSGKDDDTAISEIQFYYKGERIQLDFSKQEAVWKKT